MHIIILGPAHPLRPGGITTFNERLCRAFVEAGHDCAIWSFTLQYPGFLFPGKSQFTDAPPPTGITIIPAINSVNPLNWLTVGRRIRKARPDLVVVRYWIPFMGPCLGTILRLVKGNGHTRVVCIADNIVPHEKRPGDAWFTRYFVKPVDKFVVMSEKVLADLKRFSRKPAKLVPHPLYDNFGPMVSRAEAREALRQKFGITPAPDDKVLLFFGLVRHYKGLDLLLEAMKMVKDPGVKLLVAGEWYENRTTYDALLNDPAIKSRLWLYDQFIDNEYVKYFVCAADCVIQPYRNATQSGVTPVAYHFEVPMIVTRVGGLPEMVPHGKAGLVCEPNPASLAEAIDAYFEKGSAFFTPALLEEKKKLSWEKLVGHLLDSWGE